MLYLLGSTADKGLGVQNGVQLAQNGGKVGVSLDSGQQVVITALLFDNSCCLLGQNTDLLMAVLKEIEIYCVKHKSWFQKVRCFVFCFLHYKRITAHKYLSVPSSLHHGHDDVLCGHEGQLMADVSLDDFGVDHQTLCDVLQGAEDDVRRQEGLRKGDPPVKEQGVKWVNMNKYPLGQVPSESPDTFKETVHSKKLKLNNLTTNYKLVRSTRR